MTGRPVEELALEMLSKELEYDTWFCTEVEKGLKSLHEGRFVTHQEVKRRLARYLEPDEAGSGLKRKGAIVSSFA
jgi:predicted transcriptional regulator